jgi:hypothetical protein
MKPWRLTVSIVQQNLPIAQGQRMAVIEQPDVPGDHIFWKQRRDDRSSGSGDDDALLVEGIGDRGTRDRGRDHPGERRLGFVPAGPLRRRLRLRLQRLRLRRFGYRVIDLVTNFVPQVRGGAGRICQRRQRRQRTETVQR